MERGDAPPRQRAVDRRRARNTGSQAMAVAGRAVELHARIEDPGVAPQSRAQRLAVARRLDRVAAYDLLAEAPSDHVGSGRNAAELFAVGPQRQDRGPQLASLSGERRQERDDVGLHAARDGGVDLGADRDPAASASCRGRHQAFVSSRHATARAAAAKSGAKPAAAWMLKYRSSPHSATDAICQPAAV